jgi:hypothetical protein
VSTLCGRLPSDGDPLLDVLPLEAAAGSSRPGDPGAKPLPRCAAAQDRAGGDALPHPAAIVHLAEAIHARYRALVLVGAYGGLRNGELAGLRPSRVDLLAGAVTVAEILTEVKGKLVAAHPRRVPAVGPWGCRQSSVSWRHILPPPSGPAATSSPPRVGGRCGSRAFGCDLGCRLPRQPARRARASTTFATPPWRCGSPPARRPRRSLCTRGTPRQLDPGPPRPPDDPRPVAEGRWHPARD